MTVQNQTAVPAGSQFVVETGTTDPNVRVDLSTGASVTSAANGSFSFENVSLSPGPNLFVATASDAAGNVTPVNRVIFRVAAVQNSGQVALDWNTLALAAIRLDASSPEFASRALAMVSAAMYDAANSVNRSLMSHNLRQSSSR